MSEEVRALYDALVAQMHRAADADAWCDAVAVLADWLAAHEGRTGTARVAQHPAYDVAVVLADGRVAAFRREAA